MTGGSDTTEYPHAFTRVFDSGYRSYPNASPTARATSLGARCCGNQAPGLLHRFVLHAQHAADLVAFGGSPRHRAKSRRGHHARPGDGSVRLADRSCPPIKLARLVSLPPHRRAQPGSDTDPSATGPDRHRRTAGCRTAAAPPPRTLPQIGQVGFARPCSAIAHLDRPRRCRQVGIRAQYQGTPRAACKIRQRLGIALKRRHDRRRRSQRRHPMRR